MPDYHKLIDEYDYFFNDTSRWYGKIEVHSYITKSDSKLKAYKSLERIDDICEQNRFLRKNITAMLNKINSHNSDDYIVRKIQDIHAPRRRTPCCRWNASVSRYDQGVFQIRTDPAPCPP